MDPEKSLNLIFPTKYVIPKSLSRLAIGQVSYYAFNRPPKKHHDPRLEQRILEARDFWGTPNEILVNWDSPQKSGTISYGCFQKYGKTPKSSILIGFSFKTIHFGVPLFLETPIYSYKISVESLEKAWFYYDSF